jgi:phosphoadenosine phosphosulfate reductase
MSLLTDATSPVLAQLSAPGALDLGALNAMFESADPIKSIQWAAAEFGPDQVMMSSSFGAESAVLLHMATQIIPNIRVVFVNTGYLFPETHGFMEKLRLQMNLNVWIYRTHQDPIAYLHTAGEENPAWRKDIDRCCGINKNEPFDRAMAELKPKAWLRGIRRHQNDERADMKPLQWSRKHNCYAVSPLLNMDGKSIYYYMKQHNLPYHPLYEKGYTSIGCNPLSCTRPITLGEDPRSGRWAGSQKTECGINVETSLDSAQI